MTFDELGPMPVRIEVEHQAWPYGAAAAEASRLKRRVPTS